MPAMIGSLKFFWLKHRIQLWMKVLCIIVLSFLSIISLKQSTESEKLFVRQKQTDLSLEDLDQTIFSLNPQFLHPEFPKILESFYAFCASSIVHGTNNIHLVDQNSEAIIPLDYQNFVRLSQFIPKVNEKNDWEVKPLKVEQGFLFAETKIDSGSLQLIKIPIVDFSLLDPKKHALFLNHNAVKELKASKNVGEDLLLANSCDKEKKELYRLKIGSKIEAFEKNLKYFFKNGIWHTDQEGAELVLVLKDIDKQLVAMVSDFHGRFQHQFVIENESVENVDFSIMTPKSVHYLSKNAFFGLLGLQKMTFKEGDWILKEKNFFHILKSKNEIQQLLSFKKQGLLLIIDSIKESKTQMDVKLKVFSPLRTQMQETNLQVLVPKPITLKSKKRAVKQK